MGLVLLVELALLIKIATFPFNSFIYTNNNTSSIKMVEN